MRFNFSELELQFLHAYTQRTLFVASARKGDDGGALLRLVSKMKYKFTPNASTVYLTAKEKKAARALVDYALRGSSDLETGDIPEMLRGLKEKLK